MHFDVVRPRHGRLVVDNPEPSAVGYLPEPRTQQHAFGARKSPRFRLVQPYSPDDAWEVKVDPAGKDPEDPALPDQPWAHRWRAFLADARITVGTGLPLLLPAGVYDVLRSTRPASPTDKVLLGNVMVPAPRNVALVYPTKPVYLCAFGPDAAAPLPTNQPLVGLTLLNHTGASDWDAVWAFALYSGRAAAGAEPLVVVPREGPLVVDAMAFFFGAEGEAAARTRWQERAEAFARSVTFDETDDGGE